MRVSPDLGGNLVEDRAAPVIGYGSVHAKDTGD